MHLDWCNLTGLGGLSLDYSLGYLMPSVCVVDPRIWIERVSVGEGVRVVADGEDPEKGNSERVSNR